MQIVNCKKPCHGSRNLAVSGVESRANERDEAQNELFRTELTRIISRNHAMVRLADAIDWGDFDSCFEGMWAGGQGGARRASF